MNHKQQQVVIIHGATTFDGYEDYLESLKTTEIDPERLKPRPDWKVWLPSELGEGYEVLAPRMPNATYARYEEWRVWFERILTILNEDPILIGHSLGGIFLAKYLSENTIQKTIKATILMAAPYDDEKEESLGDFKLPTLLQGLAEQAGRIFLLQSRDDPVVPFDQVERYQQHLPTAKTMIFEDREHFNQASLPELAELIKSL